MINLILKDVVPWFLSGIGLNGLPSWRWTEWRTFWWWHWIAYAHTEGIGMGI